MPPQRTKRSGSMSKRKSLKNNAESDFSVNNPNSDDTEPKTKFWSASQAVMVKKDITHIWNKKSIRNVIVLVPALLMVIMPIVFLISSMLFSEEEMEFPQTLLRLMPDSVGTATYQQAIFISFATFLAPALFLCVVTVVTGFVASCNFILEKENDTLETIMLTSVPQKSIYNAKIAGSMVFSIMVSALSFALFFIVMLVSSIMLNVTFFFSFNWFLIVFILMPEITFFISIFVSFISPRILTIEEAFQIVGYFMMFVLFIYFLQFIGAIEITILFLFVSILILGIIDLVFYNIAARHFTAENMLTKSFAAMMEMEKKRISN